MKILDVLLLHNLRHRAIPVIYTFISFFLDDIFLHLFISASAAQGGARARRGIGDPAYYGNSAWSERRTSAQCRHPRVLVEGRARGNMHHVAQPAGTPAAQVLLNRGDDP